jgi:hypothetical protein
MLYCDAEHVRKLDNDGTTEYMDDEDIEMIIEPASRQVDYYTNNRFTATPPLSVQRATAIIALSMLSVNITQDKEVIEEQIDKVRVKYSQSDRDKLPTQAIALLQPYVKGDSYINGI